METSVSKIRRWWGKHFSTWRVHRRNERKLQQWTRARRTKSKNISGAEKVPAKEFNCSTLDGTAAFLFLFFYFSRKTRDGKFTDCGCCFASGCSYMITLPALLCLARLFAETCLSRTAEGVRDPFARFFPLSPRQRDFGFGPEVFKSERRWNFNFPPGRTIIERWTFLEHWI